MLLFYIKIFLFLQLNIISFFSRCQTETYSLVSADFSTDVSALSDPSGITEFQARFQDSAFIILLTCIFIMMIIIVILSTMLCRLKRRPRIKKRIIVSKNVTPLTDRPQQSEQCEITIENCCNMNVCETVSGIVCVILWILTYIFKFFYSPVLIHQLWGVLVTDKMRRRIYLQIWSMAVMRHIKTIRIG